MTSYFSSCQPPDIRGRYNFLFFGIMFKPSTTLLKEGFDILCDMLNTRKLLLLLFSYKLKNTLGRLLKTTNALMIYGSCSCWLWKHVSVRWNLTARNRMVCQISKSAFRSHKNVHTPCQLNSTVLPCLGATPVEMILSPQPPHTL